MSKNSNSLQRAKRSQQNRNLPEIELEVELPGVDRARHVTVVVRQGDTHLDQLEDIDVTLDQSVGILDGSVLILLV